MKDFDDDFDGFDDEEFENENEPVVNLYSDAELCNFVKEGIENKHNIHITEIQYQFGTFTFAVLTTDIANMAIPFHWNPVFFGNSTVTFTISLENYEHDYHHLERKDFCDSVKVAIKRVFGSVCNIQSVNEDDTVFGNGVEVVVKLKKGCTLSFKENPWLPITWVKDDLVAFEVDEDNYRALMNS